MAVSGDGGAGVVVWVVVHTPSLCDEKPFDGEIALQFIDSFQWQISTAMPSLFGTYTVQSLDEGTIDFLVNEWSHSEIVLLLW